MLESMTWFRQAALRWTDGERTVYFDPWGTRPDDGVADLILLTHAHDDHFQPQEIDPERYGWTIGPTHRPESRNEIGSTKRTPTNTAIRRLDSTR
jgi:Beta-lactamase superfamily domain